MVKGEGMRGVRIIAAIDLSGNDDAHRRFLLLHGANLHGRSVRAEKERRRSTFRQFQIKRVHVVTHGMEFGDVQRFEIVIGRFDFGAFNDGETDGKENVFDFLKDLADQVMRTDGAEDAGEREVDAVAVRRNLFRTLFSSDPKCFEGFFDVALELVQRLTDNGFQSGRSGLKPIFRDEGEHTSLSS